jgi:hypothetical protein
VWVLDLDLPAGCAGAVAVAIEAASPHAALEAPPAIDCRILCLQPASSRPSASIMRSAALAPNGLK